jgi:hypothetical protein
VLIPGRQQFVAMQSQVSNNITKFVRGISGIDGDSKIMKPKFGFLVGCSDVNVCGFVAFIGIEEGSLRPPT